MKPSQRIVELSKKALLNNDMRDIDRNLSTCIVMIQSLCDYLDEENEKLACLKGEHLPNPTKQGINCKRCGIPIGKRS